MRGGGSACNLGIGIKRLDPKLPVATIGLLGEDSDGQLLLQQARDEGLDCSQLTVKMGQRTTFTDAYTSMNSARRTHLFHSGTGQILCPDDFSFLNSEARIFHLGLPGLHAEMDGPWKEDDNGWVTVLKNAKSAGLKTNLELCSLAPEQLRELVVPCLNHLDYLIVNEFEIAAVAGQPTSHGQDTDIEAYISNACQVLEGTDLELVVVHYPKGAVAVCKGGERIITSSVDIPSHSIAGTNGAGDAFAAGTLYGLHEGWKLNETLQLAHASAAASMRHLGTTDAVVSWTECLQLASAFGWRDPLD